jgi:methyl-accepting chemotaxis protein WspA
MNNLSIWQRLNLAVTLLIFLLTLGGGLAFWMERAQSGADRKADTLNRAQGRIVLELSRYTAAVRGLLLKPGEPSKGDLQEARDILEKELKQASAELTSAESLRIFVQGDVVKFDKRLVELLETAPDTASAHYAGNFPAIQSQFEKLSGKIGDQAQSLSTKASDSARVVWWIAVIGILIVFIAAFFVARVQSLSVTAPMQTIVEDLEAMQRGDFTKRVKMERQDEFGTVGNGLNKLADELSVLVGQVQRSGIQVNSTATEIAATAREQQSTANEIAATTAEIGATSKEISATSKELVKTMNEVSHVSEDTAELASSGQAGIAKMEATMRQIMDASGSITAKLAVLSEKTANINTVVTTITKVADQTNLLSLNAAIEAEKAGEYGLGFAVVAMEIRRLADQTAVATYDIEKMVKEMQSAVSAGVMGMDKFSEEVRRGVEEVRQVGTQLAQIIHQVQTLTPRFHTVNEGMHAQATGAQQISETLTQLNEAAQLTAESLRQSNIAIEQLNEAAHGLQTAVARFKLKA